MKELYLYKQVGLVGGPSRSAGDASPIILDLRSMTYDPDTGPGVYEGFDISWLVIRNNVTSNLLEEDGVKVLSTGQWKSIVRFISSFMLIYGINKKVLVG